MPVINIPITLREQLGDQGADDLADLLNLVSEDTARNTLAIAEEKFERRLSEEAALIKQHTTEVESRLNQRITEVESRLNQRIIEVESRLNQRISDAESGLNQHITEVRTEIAEARADLVRWMFVFWVGQLAAMLAILFIFLK